MRSQAFLVGQALVLAVVQAQPSTHALLAGSGQNSSLYHLYSISSSGELGSPTDVAEFPSPTFLEMAAAINDSVLVCGGFDQKSGKLSEKCLISRINEEKKWTFLTNLKQPLYYGTAVPIDQDKIWITGGVDDFDENEPINKTSIVDIQTGIITEGPELPLRLDNHCALRVNSTHTFLAYGYSGEFGSSNKAFLYNWIDKKWTNLPDSIDRTGAACGIIEDEKGQKTVVATSGWSYISSDYTQTTALLTLDVDKEWRTGPEFPLRWYTTRSMVVEDKLFVIGGANLDGFVDKMFRLDMEEDAWIELDQKLVDANFGHVALSVRVQ